MKDTSCYKNFQTLQCFCIFDLYCTQQFAYDLEKAAVEHGFYTEVMNVKDYDPEDKLTEEVDWFILKIDHILYNNLHK